MMLSVGHHVVLLLLQLQLLLLARLGCQGALDLGQFGLAVVAAAAAAAAAVGPLHQVGQGADVGVEGEDAIVNSSYQKRISLPCVKKIPITPWKMLSFLLKLCILQ